MLTYKKYADTNYIILSDGTVARLLKPCKRGNSTYINFTIENKQKSVRKDELIRLFSETQTDVIPSGKFVQE
jgi:hypothetical protein